MADPSWSRDALCELIRGHSVFLRDDACGPRSFPPWLAAVAGEVIDVPLDRLLDRVHPEDALAATQGFLAAAVGPDLVDVPIRAQALGGWTHCRLGWLNLLDHPEVEGILGWVEIINGTPVDAPVLNDQGEYRATNWMMLHSTVADSRIVRADGAVMALLGYEPEELVGRVPVEFSSPDDVASVIRSWAETRRNPQHTSTSERRWRRRDGSEIWLESSSLRRHNDGDIDDVLLIVWDVTERRAQQDALREREEENRRLAEQSRRLADDFRLLADEVPAAVFRCDPDGRVTFHNARWTEMFAQDRHIDRVQDALHPEDRPAFTALLVGLLAAGARAEPALLEARAADGAHVLGLRCRTVAGDPTDEARIVGSITDITATVQLRHEARHDPLTGLYNRTALELELRAALEHDPVGTLVVYLDLDGFKGVNDTYGHDAGDEVLRVVAERLRTALRPGDVVGRHGGDEFVVVCRAVPTDGAPYITRRLQRALAPLICFTGGTWQPRASIGWARPDPGGDLAALLQRADQAMFEVKRRRNASRP